MDNVEVLTACSLSAVIFLSQRWWLSRLARCQAGLLSWLYFVAVLFSPFGLWYLLFLLFSYHKCNYFFCGVFLQIIRLLFNHRMVWPKPIWKSKKWVYLLPQLPGYWPTLCRSPWYTAGSTLVRCNVSYKTCIQFTLHIMIRSGRLLIINTLAERHHINALKETSGNQQ